LETNLKKFKALGLLSGGLDSILAVKLIQEQGIDVTGLSFETPFFGPEKARNAAARIGIPLIVLDITDIHLEMLKYPRYGYGKNMNPCIDCHALMLNCAGKKMQELGADFLFTGEVLGQRPMSQNRNSLHIVAKNSGYEQFIVRPLSARLLPETLPETEGKLNRQLLLDINGRGRKRQMAMAEKWGIDYYVNPAGGCLLTDPGFSHRLKDLFQSGHYDIGNIKLLKSGRHFRKGRNKIIAGRNRQDNEAILSLARDGDALIVACDFPGALVLVRNGADEETVRLAASICARYSDGPEKTEIKLKCLFEGKERAIMASPCEQADLEKLLI
jgi:tRNA U34 2-thiouridine synthase MnmA/TrmU